MRSEGDSVVVKADSGHNLWFERRRAEVNRLRAGRLGAVAAGSGIANPRPQPSKAAGDRAALMADIAARRRHAQLVARHALDAPVPTAAAYRLAS